MIKGNTNDTANHNSESGRGGVYDCHTPGVKTAPAEEVAIGMNAFASETNSVLCELEGDFKTGFNFNEPNPAPIGKGKSRP